MKFFLSLILLACSLGAQQTIDNSQARTTIPWKLQPTEPGICQVGEAYFNTTSGKLRSCVSLNNWGDIPTADASGVTAVPAITQSYTVGSGGVTANTFVKLGPSTPGQVVALSTTDTAWQGVALSTVSSGGTVLVRRLGSVQVLMDSGTATLNNSAIASTTNAGYLHDSGVTRNSVSILNSVAGIRTACASACSGTLVSVELTPADRGTLVPGSQLSGANAANGPVVLDANGNIPIGATVPAGAPASSIGIGGCVYATVYQVDVRCYGAKGDGTTDDTAAIQSAVNAAPTNTGFPGQSTIILFPPGQYKITSTIVIGTAQRLIFRSGGEAGSNSAAALVNTTAPNVDFIDAGTHIEDTFSMYGMQLVGAGAGTGTGNGIKLGGSSAAYDSRIEHCWFTGIPNAAINAVNMQGYHISQVGFENSTYGIYGTNTSDNIITGNRFYTLSGAAISISLGNNNTITSNHFDYTAGAGNDTNGAVVISNSSTENRNNLIANNNFRYNVNDVLLLGTPNAGSHLGVVGTIITGNASDQAIRHFLYSSASAETTIVNNLIKDASSNASSFAAIDLQGSTANATVSGNTEFINGSFGQTYGLQTGSSSTNTMIGANVLVGVTGAANLLGTTSILPFYGPVIAPNGAVGAPSLAFLSDATTAGWRRGVANEWTFQTTATGNRLEISGTAVRLHATSTFAWALGDPTSGSDTAFSRMAAAKIGAGNGTQGDVSGTIQAAAVEASTIFPAADSTTAVKFNKADNATAVVTLDTTNNAVLVAGPLSVGNGVVGTPGLAFASDLTTGWRRSAANEWTFQTFATGNRATVASGAIRIHSGSVFCATSGDSTAACDTGLSRNGAAKAFAVGNGTAGDMTGTLQAGVTATDPGCTTTSHIGKQWFNITTTTTVYQVCLNVAGTVGWVVK